MESQRADPIIDCPDRLRDSYCNGGWASRELLEPEDCLEYFAGSPFYSPDSLNTRRVMASGADVPTTGVEYTAQVPTPVTPGAPPESGLFLIERWYVLSRDEKMRASAYYALDKVVYQCPDIASVLAARVEQAAYCIQKAIDSVQRLHNLTAAGATKGSSAEISGADATDDRTDKLLKEIVTAWDAPPGPDR